MPLPSTFGFLGTSHTAPRLPVCVPTASELGERALHPMERSATFTLGLPLRHSPHLKVAVHGRRRALCVAHLRYATPICVRPPRHLPHRITATSEPADGCRVGRARFTSHGTQRHIHSKSSTSARPVFQGARPRQAARALRSALALCHSHLRSASSAPAEPHHGFPRAC